MENREPYGRQAKSEAIRRECLAPFALWVTPTSDEIRQAMKLANLTGSQLAALVGIKNSRTIRRWTGGEIEIPYAAWAILCYKAGFGIIWEDMT